MPQKSTNEGASDYSDDTPKSNPWQDDRLGFASFAERLANVILRLPASNGYVIGLHGVWGSGKSTVLKFVEAFLKKYQDEGAESKIQVIDFRPWIISGHQDLISAFFKVLREALNPEGEKKRGLIRRLGTKAKASLAPLLNAIATVGAVAEPSGAATRAASKFASASFDKLFDLWLSEPSLQSAQDKLKEELRKKHERFLVVIDDIDRLQRDEIRAIMQLVKSVGQLPNVIYLLAYDRHIVWEALDEGSSSGRGRPSFAEKIVQQEVELPVPSRQALLGMFDQEAKFLLATIKSDNGMRWFHLIQHGIHRWLRQPRDVMRLANALRFCAPTLAEEVDPHDVLAMEGLRLFDRPAFDWIRLNRDYLFSEGVFHLSDDSRRGDYGRRFRESIADGDRSDLVTVVCDLFPGVGRHIAGQKIHLGESYPQIVKRRGVGTTLGYDAYFSLFPSLDGVPKSLVDESVLRLEDESWLTAILHDYVQKKDSRGNPLIAELLREISARLYGQGGMAPTQALLNALLNAGEAILPIDKPGTFLDFPPGASWSNLITEILKVWGPERAGAHLLEALASSASPAVWADIYVTRGRELGVLPHSEDYKEQLLSDADFEAFGARLLGYIQTAAVDRSLDSAPYYYDVITAWHHLAGPGPVRTWIEGGIVDNAQFLARLSHGLLSYSQDSNGRHYTMRNRPPPELFDLEFLRDSARRYLDQGAYNGDYERRVRAILEGSENYLAGKALSD